MNAITKLLDDKGVSPEVKLSSFHYRHPQYPSRYLVVEVTDYESFVRFSRVTAEFVSRWSLDKDNVWSGDDVHGIVEDFFKIDEVNPPEGSPPFEEVKSWCEPIVSRLAIRFNNDGHYEMNGDDLYQIGMLKVYECWLDCGNKPRQEFENIVSTSIWCKAQGLLSKHFVTKARAAAEIISITDENIESLPCMDSSEVDDREESEKLEHSIYSMSEVEKEIIRQIRKPHHILRQSLSVDMVRYHKLRKSGARRLPTPRLNLTLMKHFTPFTHEEVSIALDKLMKSHQILT